MSKRAFIEPFRVLATIMNRENGAELEDLEGATATKITQAFKTEFKNDDPICVSLENSNTNKARQSVLKLMDRNIITSTHRFWDKTVVYNKAQNLLSKRGKDKQIYYMLVDDEPKPILNRTFDLDKPNTVPTTMNSAYEKHEDPFNNVNKFSSSSPNNLNQSMLTQNQEMLKDMMTCMKKEHSSLMEDFKLELVKTNRSICNNILSDDAFREMVKNEVNDAIAANGNEIADEVLEATKAVREDIENDFETKIIDLQSTISALKTRMDSIDSKAHKSISKVGTMEEIFKAMIAPKQYTKLEITQAQTEHDKLTQAYRTETFKGKKMGLIDISLLKSCYYKTEATGPADANGDATNIYVPNVNAIQNLMGLNLWIFKDGMRLSRKDNPIFKARVERKPDHSPVGTDMFQTIETLIEGRKRFKGELSVNLTLPTRFQVYGLLQSLKDDQIIVKYEDSKGGFLTLFLNDGRNDLTGPEFFDSCTRYMPGNPLLLAVLKTPTVAKLRALAKGQHFVHPKDGTIVKFNENYKGKRVSRFIAPMDNEAEFNDEFSNFLSNHGLELKDKIEDMSNL